MGAPGCTWCYGDVRGECIRGGRCCVTGERNRFRRLAEGWAYDEGGWKTTFMILIAVFAWAIC